MKQFIISETQSNEIRDNAHKAQGVAEDFDVLNPDEFPDPILIISGCASANYSAATKIVGILEKIEAAEGGAA